MKILGISTGHDSGASLVVNGELDADIYSSTLFLLFQLDNFTPYYALFDEFGGDEARALYDYLISTDKKIEISATTFDDRFKIVPGKTFMKIY